ncbi:hypothetical protein ACFY8S_09275 [Streptomyces hygroscopicus]|uniref:hypothetical protein n=1 Tax=Streptomyces hygroscopicus TaxID=1912 RepID=UPI00369DA095
MSRYQITFERVGRHGGRNGSKPPAPITVEAADGPDLAAQVLTHSRRYLASRAVEIHIDLDAGCGWLIAGFHQAGEFTVEQMPDRVRVLDDDGRFLGGEGR